jgi:hypothetical protein
MALFSFCIGAPASPVAISFSPQLFGYSILVIGILVIVSWLLVSWLLSLGYWYFDLLLIRSVLSGGFHHSVQIGRIAVIHTGRASQDITAARSAVLD